MNAVPFTKADFESPNIRRLCDVVMKGGVTSGVVYPTAVCKLATAYAIKNIGGTSVGAIAAAITAAAEYRRRVSGSGQGYLELAKLPGFLGAPGSLLALFAPDAVARDLFKVALIPIGCGSLVAKALRLIGTLLWQYVWIPLLTIAVIFGTFVGVAWPLPPGVVWRCLGAAIVFGLIAAFVGIAIRFVYRLLRVLDGNSFGWCHGYDANARITVDDVTQLDAKQVPPLFNWLEAFIAQTAGTTRAQPLTFGQLWSAPHPAWHNATPTERCIDFRMVTTCLTLGRPFELPFDTAEQFSQVPDPDTDVDAADCRRPSIYFRAEDLKDYFSDDVVRHMTRHGAITALGKCAGDTAVYYRFPAAENVPTVVATRMSMSFPVLFCALPLYALDANGCMQKLWFSDGGLSSNFPIHFFDSPLPCWPTFAIDLLPGAPAGAAVPANTPGHYAPGAVVMESAAPPGTVNPWNNLDSGSARGNVLAFTSSILDAARTWQDVTLGTLPGNASRIVGIRLSADEGGLNLNMPPPVIAKMTQLGLSAGDTLLTEFAAGGDAPGWKAHRWVRYRAIMAAHTRWAQGYQDGYAPFTEVPAQTPYDALIDQLVPAAQSPGVLAATAALATLPIDQTFYALEQPPIAVLPTRPVV
ncbi:MAG TPA: hypothetical protein VIW73_09095 [Candidatus Cybelea sp.]